jgi:hypothetical protein
MVLASAAVASGLIVTGAQARGGGGHGGGGGMVRMGFRGGARMEGFGAGRMTGMQRGRVTVLAAPALGQTETPSGYAGGYIPAPVPGILNPSPVTVTGPGLNVVGPNDVSTKTVRAVPCSTAARETDGTTTCVGLQ